MILPEIHSNIDTTSDAELVAACRGGDRAAFGKIVERYQRLLCSLAYSATGQVSESEDIAQETFVDAWRQVGDLREPEKLRSWLCGILRFKVSRSRRTDRREPVRQADTLDTVAEDLVAADEPVADLAMQREKQAIMWNALERVPILYREPLVLYYREHRSVEHVAVALDLTEEAVRQRLARGRKILQEQVLAFVEGALVRSTPGRVFTIAVLTALPDLVTPASAAGLGAAAQGGLVAKTAGVAAVVAYGTGVVSAVLALRANLDQARTPRERRAVVKITIILFFGAMAFIAALYGLRAGALHWSENRVGFAVASQVVVLTFVIGWPVILVRMMRMMRAMRTAERREHPELFRDPRDQAGSEAGEYRSRWKLFGVPLVHIRFAWPGEDQGPVFAWVAGGDRAYGLLMAWGGIAIAPVSVGAVAGGFLAVGSLSVGVISMGTFAVGALAMGCAAVGINAFAWLSALGWETAAGGGFALAGNIAVGPVALAAHANDAVARAALVDPNAQQNEMIFLIVISLLCLVPITAYARAVRQRLGRRPAARTGPGPA